jgi:prophage DNA circulation protein
MKAEGFDHQVVRTEVKATDARIHLLPGSQNQYRQVSVQTSNLCEDLFPILDRHVEIQNGQIGQVLTKGLYGGSSIMGQANAMSVSLQTPAQKQSQRLVVFGDQ